MPDRRQDDRRKGDRRDGGPKKQFKMTLGSFVFAICVTLIVILIAILITIKVTEQKTREKAYDEYMYEGEEVVLEEDTYLDDDEQISDEGVEEVKDNDNADEILEEDSETNEDGTVNGDIQAQ